MQDVVTARYADLAIRYAGEVASVSEAWRAHFRSGSHLALHDSDGSHPRPEGSYLAAAVIAATIIDEGPRHSTGMHRWTRQRHGFCSRQPSGP